MNQRDGSHSRPHGGQALLELRPRGEGRDDETCQGGGGKAIERAPVVLNTVTVCNWAETADKKESSTEESPRKENGDEFACSGFDRSPRRCARSSWKATPCMRW